MSDENDFKIIEDSTVQDRWPNIKRKHKLVKVPLGYKPDPEDDLNLVPDYDKVSIIEKAFDYLDNGNTVRETSEWLNQKLLTSFVHQTLVNAYKRHRKAFQKKPRTKNKPKVRHTAHSRSIISEKATARHALNRVAKLEKQKLEAEKKARTAKPRDLIPESEKPLKTPVIGPRQIFKDAPEETKVFFKPNPGPQTQFLSAPEEEVLYGGAAGGGKSYALLADPMRYFHNGNFVGLLIRRTNDELKELIRKSKEMYPKAYPGATWREKDSMWRFPSGAELWITYLDRDDDVLRYQGQSFCWIAFDELTQYASPYPWTYLKSRLRTTDPELKKYLSMRATTNPGGPGHAWVKKMFVDPAVPGEAFWATDIETGEVLCYPDNHPNEELRGKPLFKRRFIPAKLSDNPYLSDDGLYERSLHGLPEAQRRKLLDGDWGVVEGAAFPEFNPSVHVVPSFDIPDNWVRFRSGDFGYSSFSAVLWFAINPSTEQLVVYRELYVSKKTGVELADLVLEKEYGESIKYGRLDSSVWHQRGHWGPSIAEEMIARGCRWTPSDRGQGSRTAGKNRLHELLKIDPYTGEPGIIFFENCRQLIADLPMIPADPDGNDDIDDRFKSDHTYDALRYGIMSRPRSGSALDWGRTPMNTYTPANRTFGY